MRISTLVRHIIFTGSAATLVSAISYFIGIILARSLGPAGRGELSIALNSLNLLYPLTSLGLRQACAFMIARQNFSMQAARILQVRMLPFASTLTFVAFLMVATLSSSTSLRLTEALAIAAIIPLRLFFEFRSGLFLARKRLPEYSALQIVQPLAEAVFVITAFLLAGPSVSVYLYCMSGAYFIAAAVQSRQLGRNVDDADHFAPVTMETMIKAAKLGITYALPLFVMGLNYSADIAILSLLGTPSEKVGFYTISISISSLIWFVPIFVNTAIFSHSLNKKESDDRDFSIGVIKYSSIMFAALSIISLLFAITVLKKVIIFIYGADYADVYKSLCLLLPGTLAMLFFKVLNGNLAARGHPGVAIKVFGPMAALNIALNLWWIPEYHELGAAAATTISYVLGTAIYLVMYWKIAIKVS